MEERVTTKLPCLIHKNDEHEGREEEEEENNVESTRLDEMEKYKMCQEFHKISSFSPHLDENGNGIPDAILELYDKGKEHQECNEEEEEEKRKNSVEVPSSVIDVIPKISLDKTLPDSMASLWEDVSTDESTQNISEKPTSLSESQVCVLDDDLHSESIPVEVPSSFLVMENGVREESDCHCDDPPNRNQMENRPRSRPHSSDLSRANEGVKIEDHHDGVDYLELEPSSRQRIKQKINSWNQRRRGTSSGSAQSVSMSDIEIRAESVERMLSLQNELFVEPDKYNDPSRYGAFDLSQLDYEGMEACLKSHIFHHLKREEEEVAKRQVRWEEGTKTLGNGFFKEEENEKDEERRRRRNNSVSFSSSEKFISGTRKDSDGMCDRMKAWLKSNWSFWNKRKSTVTPETEQQGEGEEERKYGGKEPLSSETATSTCSTSTNNSYSTTLSSCHRRKELQSIIEGRTVTNSSYASTSESDSEEEEEEEEVEEEEEEEEGKENSEWSANISAPKSFHNTSLKTFQTGSQSVVLKTLAD